MSVSSIKSKIYHWMAGSKPMTQMCVRLRNQANMVIKMHIGGRPGINEGNGETLLINKIAPQSKYFVDIGAHMGEWSGHFCEISKAEGTLFEPGKKCFEAIQKRFAGTPLNVCQCAVGDVVGNIEFVEDLDTDYISSVASAYTGLGHHKKYSVPITTLDNEFYDEAIEIDFVKIDAEGYDYHVLVGSKSLLREQKIKIIQFEYNTGWKISGTTLRRAVNFLEEHKYTVYLLREDGLHSMDFNYWGEYFGFSNFVAVSTFGKEMLKDLIRG